MPRLTDHGRGRTARLNCGHWVTILPWYWRLRLRRHWPYVYPPAAVMWRGTVKCKVHGLRPAEDVWTRDEMGRPVSDPVPRDS